MIPRVFLLVRLPRAFGAVEVFKSGSIPVDKGVSATSNDRRTWGFRPVLKQPVMNPLFAASPNHKPSFGGSQ
jgi:hypothetical protein